ncbi:MAG: hypothetical protein DMG76_29545 [Acidobacteria bacterium]|nr:MAG: hypothetical protein DMG76_29545 [Acidobacteriota bacterium]
MTADSRLGRDNSVPTAVAVSLLQRGNAAGGGLTRQFGTRNCGFPDVLTAGDGARGNEAGSHVPLRPEMDQGGDQS